MAHETASREPSVTERALEVFGSARDPRLREVVTALLRHVHAFVREVRLTPDEWARGIDYLTRVGQKCDAFRQEFILLSDVLGVSMAVDEVDHESDPPGVTPSSAFGPFYTDDAPEVPRGAGLPGSGSGETARVRGVVRDRRGAAIAGALVETWETDPVGTYDVQYADRVGPEHRGRQRTAADGTFDFVAIKPVSYPVPVDGPVGELLRALSRSNMRPAHQHFMISAPGYRTLTTALYVPGDPYLETDAVFGAKPTLLANYRDAAPEEGTRWVLEPVFVLADAPASP